MEYLKPLSEQEYDANFKQKKPLMNATEAFAESSRCLFCYDAPCVKACPTHIDIPLFIKQIHTDNSTGAAATIYEQNWLGNACGKVCPTQVLCEGACVFNHQQIRPIDIGRLQNFATHAAIQSNKKLFKKGTPIGKKVAIIGAGPAGIACACELAALGYAVEIFEAKKQPSGLTVHGTAPYKITNEEALAEVKYLQKQLGFVVHYQHVIHTKEQLGDLEARFDAIFLGVGLGATSTLGTVGEQLSGVVGAVEFVEMLRAKKHKMKVPKTVVVLGGGNTAMDAASECLRMGAEKVYLAYRRSKEEMGAYIFEYDLAKVSGMQPLFNTVPVEILGSKKVTGVRLRKTQVMDGKLRELPNSDQVIRCNMVIKATGQAKMGHLLQLIGGIATDQSGRINVQPDTYCTTNAKYYAGGDAVNGGAEVVNAAHEGKMAALGIHKALGGI